MLVTCHRACWLTESVTEFSSKETGCSVKGCGEELRRTLQTEILSRIQHVVGDWVNG